ncbi:putative signal transducing protein [Arenimonas daejeonensis]|uniref:putative signal transducing protein n=1 Tax=Arenimonas daejeonensis TaxID=370777 RepID=UPI0011BE0B6F|nr:DUF2007 domain-containing protein [Arenimonas daejeonensis]
MTPIYTAESTLDAQLVQDLLLGAGITAHVFGRNVAGAIPEVPDSGQIRVVVEDDEADLARAMIQDWQTGPELDGDDLDLGVDSVLLDDDA